MRRTRSNNPEASHGEAPDVSVETIKTHLRQILGKLRLRNRVEATAYVFRTGAFSRYQPADPDDAERPPPGR